jgi:hypothetical protein
MALTTLICVFFFVVALVLLDPIVLMEVFGFSMVMEMREYGG